MSSNILATMFTFTTYGTWLRGDQRGWVQHGQVYSENPQLEASDRARMKHAPFYFDEDQWFEIGDKIGTQLTQRSDVKILAMAIRSWHVHFLVSASCHEPGVIAKCAKDAVRYHLRPGRPIWTTGYDKRYCFDEQTVFNRVRYIERHNTELDRPPRPWDFITDWRM
ncbi:hypothetical protein AB1L42_17115 [Thalassoglobus sp. JC818]|uniref:hypothetical protein n=1 Tax=Thalassoglobus sp. JC818 TaxID=3232136 RepID=UPI003458B3B3